MYFIYSFRSIFAPSFQYTIYVEILLIQLKYRNILVLSGCNSTVTCGKDAPRGAPIQGHFQPAPQSAASDHQNTATVAVVSKRAAINKNSSCRIKLTMVIYQNKHNMCFNISLSNICRLVIGLKKLYLDYIYVFVPQKKDKTSFFGEYLSLMPVTNMINFVGYIFIINTL